eukprot:TRINITY_DN4607_c0_g4_i4.p1 TRINITY_DN4607_c0_g4~~TRINITY_DN4607_c0_g4_i4.p1  ORF type:complete len:190 (+),score=40.19 TRINITY_DN4607_c0_g4_i4:164-733(+)
MPFLSEELWAYCSKSNRDNILVNTKYPHEGDAYLIEDITSENEAKALLATVQGLRSLKQQYSSKVDWSTPAGIVVQGNESQIFYEKHIKEIGHLSKLHHVSVTLSPPQDASVRIISPEISVYLQTPAQTEQDRAIILRKMAKVTEEIGALESKIHSDDFVKKAKPAIQERERNRLQDLYKLLKSLQENA